MRTILIQLLEQHQAWDDTEEAHRRHTLDFLHANTNCTSPSNLKGHITASAWLLSPTREHALLTHHRKLDRWLQLGGHVENDATIQAAAEREAREESGMSDLSLLSRALFDVDVHTIPQRQDIPEHEHYDLRFVFASATDRYVTSNESKALSWVPLVRMSEFVSDVSMLRMVAKSKPYTHA